MKRDTAPRLGQIQLRHFPLQKLLLDKLARPGTTPGRSDAPVLKDLICCFVITSH